MGLGGQFGEAFQVAQDARCQALLITVSIDGARATFEVGVMMRRPAGRGDVCGHCEASQCTKNWFSPLAFRV
jgi:hypothetical protein